MDAIILFGGKGTRMESELPKALVPVKGKSIISYSIDYLLTSKHINKIILALGYKSDMVMDYIKKNYPEDKILFSTEHEPLGTGGAVRKAMLLSGSDFLLVQNGDDITNINLEELSKKKENTICVANCRLPFGRITEKNGYALFEEKPMLTDWVSCGWYLFNRKELLSLLSEKCSLEYDVFPKIKLRVHYHKGTWLTFNSKKDIQEFEAKEIK